MRLLIAIASFAAFANISAICAPAKKSQASETIKAAVKTMADRMKDPGSVQFKDVVFVEETQAVCGRFNAKNSYGAYVGFEFFTVGADGAPHVYGGDKCVGPATPEKAACLKHEMDDLAVVKANCSKAWPQSPK